MDDALSAAAQSNASEHVVIGSLAIAAFLALLTGAWLMAISLTRRIIALRELLSHMQDRERARRPAGDELDSLSQSLHKAIFRSKERETQLRRSAEFLEFAQTAGGFGIFDLDLATGRSRHAAVLRAHRLASAQRSISSRTSGSPTVHPRGLRDRRPCIQTRAIGIGRQIRGANTARSRSDGERRWLAGRGEVCAMPRRVPARVIGTITDITERKQLEDTLAKTTESLNIAQTAAGVATMDLDFGRRSWICSDNFRELLGLPHRRRSRIWTRA